MINAITDLVSLKQAIADLLEDNFYAPDLLEEPSFRKNGMTQDVLRERDAWLIDNYSKDEVILSKGFKLVKDHTLSHYRCRTCACARLFIWAPDGNKDNFKFPCGSMPCHEPSSLREKSFFLLVRAATKPEGYTPDQFDFSDWDAIKRATGF